MGSVTISVYLSHSRIRIHRDTLDALDNPPYVILVVNPREKALGIMGSQSKTPVSHRINPHPVRGKLNCELYSATLIGELQNLCPFMDGSDDQRSWSFEGKVYPSENLAVFPLVNPIPEESR